HSTSATLTAKSCPCRVVNECSNHSVLSAISLYQPSDVANEPRDRGAMMAQTATVGSICMLDPSSARQQNPTLPGRNSARSRRSAARLAQALLSSQTGRVIRQASAEDNGE